MKILLLMAVVMALGHGMAERCMTRKDKRTMRQIFANTRCNSPQEALIQLPVPAGFDYVKPNVVKLKQCTGLSCHIPPERCLPSSESITNKTYKVYAFRVEDPTVKYCVEVKVEEHGACECRCDKTECPRDQVFNEETCECECSWKSKNQCLTRRKEGIDVMWEEKTCSCPCDKPLKCGSSMIMDQKSCSCVLKNYVDF